MGVGRDTSATNNTLRILFDVVVSQRARWHDTTGLAHTKQGTKTGLALVPRRLESRGLSSKTLIPSISPSSWRRSRPVACSMSVGTPPAFPPGPNIWGAGGPPDWVRIVVEKARVKEVEGLREARAAKIAGRAARTAFLNMAVIAGILRKAE